MSKFWKIARFKVYGAGRETVVSLKQKEKMEIWATSKTEVQTGKNASHIK